MKLLQLFKTSRPRASQAPRWPVDHANRAWCTNPTSNAWWRAQGLAEAYRLKLRPRVLISRLHADACRPVMFKRTLRELGGAWLLGDWS
jgi:hypothetical protein